MTQTKPPVFGNPVARVLLCIHQVRSGEPAGEYATLYMEKPASFSSIIEMVNGLDAYFDEMDFPQAYNRYRSFDDGSQPTAPANGQQAVQKMDERVFATLFGQKATFVVQVLFRQNSTWQGTVCWTEQRKTQRFRSTLELIKLLDSAVAADESETEAFSDWD